jgi:hypothetical protein
MRIKAPAGPNVVALVAVLAVALPILSCHSSNNGEEGTSSPNPPSQSTPSPSATPTFNERLDTIIEALPTREEPVDTIIEGLIERYFGAESSSSFRIGTKHYFTDSSGTSWIGFPVVLIYRKQEGVEVPTAVVKRVPGGEWELVSLGTGPPSKAVPDDVRKGLGIY